MPDATPATGGGPTVVLVHGAFADSSGWSGVVERLQAAGVAVQAVSNPLRGIFADAAYVASAISQVPGPVLAVGHSYGGATITNAAGKCENVVGLVYVSGFAPDEGEVLSDIESDSKDSVLPRPWSSLSTRPDRGRRLQWSSRSIRQSSMAPSPPTSPRS